ncbi:hypothetical protein SVIOM74S_05132 [Streptomyces violarus]
MAADPVGPHPGRLSAIDPEPGVRKPDPLLVLDQVTRTFGGLVAVRVEHLEVSAGPSRRSSGRTAPARPPCSTW